MFTFFNKSFIKTPGFEGFNRNSVKNVNIALLHYNENKFYKISVSKEIIKDGWNSKLTGIVRLEVAEVMIFNF